MSNVVAVFYRPKWEGGRYEGDENERLDVLRLAMELGADYIDVELKVIIVTKLKIFLVFVFDVNYPSCL